MAGCGQQAVRLADPVSPTIPSGSLLAGEAVEVTSTSGAKATIDQCYSAQILPAVIETVTEQSLLTEAGLGPDGVVLTPATYQTRTQQRMITDRREVRFAVPCPGLADGLFIETLQRALKVRGLYSGPVTGEIDSPTARAIRRYQAPQGLDSSVLSLAAARQLGLVTLERDALE